MQHLRLSFHTQAPFPNFPASPLAPQPSNTVKLWPPVSCLLYLISYKIPSIFPSKYCLARSPSVADTAVAYLIPLTSHLSFLAESQFCSKSSQRHPSVYSPSQLRVPAGTYWWDKLKVSGKYLLFKNIHKYLPFLLHSSNFSTWAGALGPGGATVVILRLWGTQSEEGIRITHPDYCTSYWKALPLCSASGSLMSPRIEDSS